MSVLCLDLILHLLNLTSLTCCKLRTRARTWDSGLDSLAGISIAKTIFKKRNYWQSEQWKVDCLTMNLQYYPCTPPLVFLFYSSTRSIGPKKLRSGSFGPQENWKHKNAYWYSGSEMVPFPSLSMISNASYRKDHEKLILTAVIWRTRSSTQESHDPAESFYGSVSNTPGSVSDAPGPGFPSVMPVIFSSVTRFRLPKVSLPGILGGKSGSHAQIQKSCLYPRLNLEFCQGTSEFQNTWTICFCFVSPYLY